MKERLKNAPITVEAFFEKAAKTYYSSLPAIGQDFVTAPLISPLFGTILGLWVQNFWEERGKPTLLNLMELGSGQGHLLRDLLNVLSPDLKERLHVHSIDINSSFLKNQKDLLSPLCASFQGYASLEDLELKKGPLVIIANEFFDALPIKQYVLEEGTWVERHVLVHNGELVFSSHGPIREEGVVHKAIMKDLASLLKTHTGAGLFIDYGYETGEGETLQALYRHNYISPLTHVGEADMTAHVDFSALSHEALAQGLTVYPLMTQRAFLKNNGIDLLYGKYLSKVQNRGLFTAGYERLISPLQMGSLFKVLHVEAL